MRLEIDEVRDHLFGAGVEESLCHGIRGNSHAAQTCHTSCQDASRSIVECQRPTGRNAHLLASKLIDVRVRLSRDNIGGRDDRIEEAA